jgi:hypothetical protein
MYRRFPERQSKEAVPFEKELRRQELSQHGPGSCRCKRLGRTGRVRCPHILQALLSKRRHRASLRKRRHFDFSAAPSRQLVEDIMSVNRFPSRRRTLATSRPFVKHRFQRITVVREKKVVGILRSSLFAMTNAFQIDLNSTRPPKGVDKHGATSLVTGNTFQEVAHIPYMKYRCSDWARFELSQ